MNFSAWLSDFYKNLFHKKSSTVTYAFPVVLLVMASLMYAAVTSTGSSHVRIHTTPSFIKAGEEFTIEVYASTHVPTNAIEITIDYPENRVDITGIDTGESVITLWTQDPYAEDGTIYLSGGVFRKGFLGEHLIAKVRAVATESGVTKILTSNADFVAGDGKGTTVQVSETGDETAEVFVSDSGKLTGDLELQIVTDLDGDGDVDFTDIQRFMQAWFTRNATFDFNGDGRMTFRDFSILLADSFFK